MHNTYTPFKLQTMQKVFFLKLLVLKLYSCFKKPRQVSEFGNMFCVWFLELFLEMLLTAKWFKI